MAAAENVNTPDVENRDQDVYIPRSEEDLEAVIDEMEDVESQEVEDAVREISEIADDTLRSVGVTNHFEAPIRSLNNPTENEVELENGTEAQVVGEEYFVGQNVPGFQDVGNIKWWTVMDDGSYREETRNGGLEHLQLNNEGDIHSYRIELDGEEIRPEQAQRLARNLRIRRENNTPVDENTIPSHIMEYSSSEELLENEDLTEDEYIADLEEAENYGLITEDGELTLKGFIASQDMEARDLRALENASNGAETISTATRGVLDNFAEGDFSESIELSFTGFTRPLGNMSTDIDTTGEEIEVPDSSPASYLDITETNRGIEVNMGRIPADEILNSYFPEEVVENSEVNVPALEQRNPELAENLISRAESSRSDINYSDAEGTATLSLTAQEEEVEEAHRDVLKSEFDLTMDEISTELEENSSIEVSEEKISVNYEGDRLPDRLVESIEREKTPRWDEGEIDLYGTVLQSTAQLVLDDFSDELKEKHDFNTSSRSIYESINNYQEISTELDEKIHEMEEAGIIETEVIEREPTEVKLNPEEKEDYRLIDRLDSETSIDLPSDTKELESQRLKADRVRVRRDYNSIEELDEALEEHREEITALIAENTSRKIWENVGRDRELDYTAEGLKRKIHEFVDSKDSKILKGLRYDLMGGNPDKEVVREEIAPAYGNLEFTTSEDADLAEYMEDALTPASQDLYETLEELEDEGLLELRHRDQKEWRRNHAETEVLDYEENFEIENYHELEEEDKQRLRELEEKDILEIEEGRRLLDIEDNRADYILDINTESQTIDASGEELRLRGEYQESTSYEVNDQIREIGEQLDPLNFESDPYEEVTVDNDFEYGGKLSA